MTFDNSEYNKILTNVEKIIGKAGRKLLEGSYLAKIVASAPYVAGSEDSDRYAVMNLIALYTAKSLPEVYSARESDSKDIYKRFDGLYYGYNADKKVVQYVKDYLALTMLSNYKKDVSVDKAAGKYNPASQKSFNIDKKITDLSEKINKSKIKSKFEEPVTGTAAVVSPMFGNWL